MPVSVFQDVVLAAAYGIKTFYAEHWLSGISLVPGATAQEILITHVNTTGFAQLASISTTTHFKEVAIHPGAFIKVAYSVNRVGVEAPGNYSHTGAWAMHNVGAAVLTYRPSPYQIIDEFIIAPGETLVYKGKPTVLPESSGLTQHIGLTFTAATLRTTKIVPQL
jgi:hypothetical protein